MVDRFLFRIFTAIDCRERSGGPPEDPPAPFAFDCWFKSCFSTKAAAAAKDFVLATFATGITCEVTVRPSFEVDVVIAVNEVGTSIVIPEKGKS